MTRLLAAIGILALAVAVDGSIGGAQTLPGGIKIPSGGGGKKPPGDVKIPGVGADCGSVSTTAAGAKVTAFLAATADVEKATAQLEGSVKDACRAMAKELQVSPEGDTKAVCNRVAAELRNSLKVGVKGKGAVAVKYQPAVCKVDASYTAQVAAKCEGKAKADVKVSCKGSCSGTCNGACAGTCESKNAKGQCAGECKGTCKGSCSGDCSGSANVDGSAECKASANAQGNVKATCTEPKVDVDVNSKLVVDASKVERAQKAMQVGLPAILSANAKAKLIAASVKTWATTARSLAGGSATLIRQLGAQAMCVAGDLAGAAKGAAQVNVSVSVSVQASASVSGAAGASAK